jgi:hypothetical protein
MRLHLFEFNDQPWLPEVLRRHATGLLATLFALAHRRSPKDTEAIAALVAEGLGDGDTVVDLCSGGGGPWPALIGSLQKITGREITVTLTDLHPNHDAFARLARTTPLLTCAEPVDATAVQRPGMRTIFDGLHHLPPDTAAAVLADAARSGAPILVFEATARHPAHILYMLLGLPIVNLLVTPLIRPFDWRFIPLTWLLPVTGMVVVWDGLVSCLRSYTRRELIAMADAAGVSDYTWRTGSLAPGDMAMVYLLGIPGRSSDGT